MAESEDGWELLWRSDQRQVYMYLGEQACGHQGEKRSEMNWETAIDMYVLTMIKQITKGT